VHVSAVRLVLMGAAVDGATVQDLLDAAGLAGGLTGDAHARVPAETAWQVWAAALARSPDRDFGLHLAEFMNRLFPPPVPVQDAGLTLRYAAAGAPTLGAMLERIARYWRVLDDGAEVWLEDGAKEGGGAAAGTLALCHRLSGDGELFRHVAELTLLSWFGWALAATENAWAPREIRFRHPAPANVSEHQRIFSTSLTFSADCNAIVVERRLLSLPLRPLRPTHPLDPSIDELLGAAAGHGMISRARAAVVAELGEGEPTAARVAARLRMSSRTYHRRLADQGTSHRDLLDGLRRELAVRWLRDPRASTQDVAWRLGFSDASAFHRAFRRWNGTSLLAWRKSRAPAPPRGAA
jgi:AraC-like DNA-binding protein